MLKTKPLVLIVVAMVVIVVFVWFVANKPLTSETQTPSLDGQSATQSPTTPTPPTPTEANPTPPPPTAGPTPTLSAPNTSINFTAPALGEKWVSGKNNTIQWNKDIGFKGEIYLISASDRSIVGWILTETGIHQTSYAWNTRDVFVSKTNPSKKTVLTGDYFIKAVFSTNPKIEFTSPSFSIIYENEVYIPTYLLTIKDYAFLIPSLTVKKGDKITFVNNDSVVHTLNLSSYSPFVIQPSTSYTFNTSVLTQGSYNFYSQQYPTLKLTVTVQ